MRRSQDALCRVTFSVAPTCIDVNQHTATSQQLDVLVGFVSGDIFWFGASFVQIPPPSKKLMVSQTL